MPEILQCMAASASEPSVWRGCELGSNGNNNNSHHHRIALPTTPPPPPKSSSYNTNANNNNNGYCGTAKALLHSMPITSDQNQLSELAAGWPDLSEAPSAAAAGCAQVAGKENSSTSSSKKRKAGGDAAAEDTIGEKKKSVRRDDQLASSDSPKGKESSKTDYIHVRARRGQATDSHSLAERVRRERISERMRYLQELVPGCNKIAGKAGMLDEIINYVQSLQRQVEFLSMKLAAVHPSVDFNIDNFFSKEMNPACSDSVQALEMSSEVIDASHLQMNALQQAAAACCGVDLAMSSPELAALRRTMSAPVSAPEILFDYCFNVHGNSSLWETEFQSLYNSMELIQGRGSDLPIQSIQGNLLPNNLKMEM